MLFGSFAREPAPKRRASGPPLVGSPGVHSRRHSLSTVPCLLAGLESAPQASFPSIPLALAFGSGSPHGHLLRRGHLAPQVCEALAAWSRLRRLRPVLSDLDGLCIKNPLPGLPSGRLLAKPISQVSLRRGILGSRRIRAPR